MLLSRISIPKTFTFIVGRTMPDEFLDWMKNNVKINYLQLPQDVQEGITGVLFHSAKIKSTIQKFIINLPA